MNDNVHRPNSAGSPSGRTGEESQHGSSPDSSQLRLAETLLALAEDVNQRPLRRVVSRLADQALQGGDLGAALESMRRDLPPYMQRAIGGGVTHGQAAALLTGLARHETTRKKLRRQMRSVLLYPAIVLVLLAVVMAGMMTFVVPPLQAVYEDFDLELPQVTQAIIAASRVVPWIVVAMLLAPVAYFVILLLPGGARMLHWLRTSVPLLGRVWVWNAHHEFASILGALTAERIVLADALRSTVDSLRDRNLARAARVAAAKCQSGMRLSQSLAESIHFDRTLPALVAWGEANDALPEALRQATELYEEELDLHAAFLRRVLPPLLFAAIMSLVFFMIAGLMAPLVDLISNLSG